MPCVLACMSQRWAMCTSCVHMSLLYSFLRAILPLQGAFSHIRTCVSHSMKGRAVTKHKARSKCAAC